MLDSPRAAITKNRQTAFWVVFQPDGNNTRKESVYVLIISIHTVNGRVSTRAQSHTLWPAVLTLWEPLTHTHTQTNRGAGVYVSKHECMIDLAVKLEPHAQQLTDHQRLYHEMRKSIPPAAARVLSDWHMETSDCSLGCFFIVQLFCQWQQLLLMQVRAHKKKSYPDFIVAADNPPKECLVSPHAFSAQCCTHQS